MSRAYKRLILVAVASLLFGLGIPASYRQSSPVQAAVTRPNIVFVVADDMRKDDLKAAYMPQTTKLIRNAGMSFDNAFVSNPLCCPTRVTMLRGQYMHNNGIWSNTNAFDPDPSVHDGGWQGFEGNGYEDDNVATRLHDAGYATGLFGKYLNGYRRAPASPPPKWDDWFAFRDLRYYDYDVNDNGTRKHFGTSEGDYSTDVINGEVQQFIGRNASQGKPFFAYVAPYAPHEPATPAPRDEHTFDAVRAPRLPSFNEADVSDKPPQIRSLPRLTSTDIARIDERHESRVESLQAVDDLVAGVVSKLKAQGVLSNTYIVFTSDNGFHHGEHRIQLGKQRPYEEDVRMPLVVRGPGVQAGSTATGLTLDTDFFPTFTDLAGAASPAYIDGRSFRPILEGNATTWRTAILLEHNSFSAVRTADKSKYVTYANGFKELYNLQADPYELDNSYNAGSPPAGLATRLHKLEVCAGSGCSTAENGGP